MSSYPAAGNSSQIQQADQWCQNNDRINDKIDRVNNVFGQPQCDYVRSTADGQYYKATSNNYQVVPAGSAEYPKVAAEHARYSRDMERWHTGGK